MNDPDWPDSIDRDTGVFTYYGDNKKAGGNLINTGRDGNRILENVFAAARSGRDGRAKVPPILLFAKAGSYRDVIFLGLAVPGISDAEASEELVAVWRTSGGSRFVNYRARFTILDANAVSRDWINSMIARNRDDSLAPEAWRTWLRTGRRRALISTRSREYRGRDEQLPTDKEGQSIVEAIREHFKNRPHAFEHCAATIARLMIPNVATLDVTRPSRDGGRDAVGQMRVGSGASEILIDFALEAKCYSPPNAVNVRDMSRLISRLRHRQFGVIVTTSCVDLQTNKEIKKDGHRKTTVPPKPA